jgi:DNA-binding NarL/FixJ family response regulator
MIRLGVAGLLADRFEVDEAIDGDGAMQMITSQIEYDVAIVELVAGAKNGNGHLNGIRAIRALRKARPGLGLVAHGVRPERHAANQALEAGANTFVAKSSPPESLIAAVDAACEAERFIDPQAKHPNGRVGVTRRQREILQLYADGLSTATVAKRLGLSTETVKTHGKAVLARLEARDRAHVVATGLRSGLIE